MLMSAGTTQSLTPNISSVGPQRWKTFIKNEELSCYSFYLPHSASAAADVAANEREKKKKAIARPPERSFAFVSTAQLDEWFRELHPSNYEVDDDDDDNDGDDGEKSAWSDATYKNRLLLRKTAWHVLDDDCSCEYGYSDTWQPLIRNRFMMNALKEITRAVSDAVGVPHDELNSVNLNYYPRGGGVGFHADDEFLFDGLNRETRIVSLSLCSRDAGGAASGERGGDCGEVCNNDFGARKFQVKRRGDDNRGSVNEITLRHGDLMTMEGMFQKYYLHSVWPQDSKEYVDHELCQGERINLTWRTIVRHLDGSEECRGLKCPLASRERG